MNRIKIFTDSTADLSKDILDKFNISFIPLYVTVGEKTYIDGVTLNTRELYALVEKHQVLPKTSAPPVMDFIDLFKPWLEKGYDVIYVGLSSKLSSTFQNACLAANELGTERLHLIDSLNLSTGIGLLALEAAELVQKGMSAVEVVQEVSKSVPKIRTSFIIDTLKYLHMGGRCSAMQRIAGSILKIRPQILVKEGGMIVADKFRGKRKNCLDQFFEQFIGDGSQVSKGRLFITHSESHEDAEYFRKKIKDNFDIEEIIITEAGIVISSHCGPGTLGFLYKEK